MNKLPADRMYRVAQTMMTLLHCSSCGTPFAVPAFRYEEGFLKDGVPIFCPNGHKSELPS